MRTKGLQQGLASVFIILATQFSFHCIGAEEVAVTASSVQTDEYPAKNAFDGDRQTRWSSQASDPQWLKVDLGAVREITGLTILWETAYGDSYDVQVSEDDVNWKTLYSVTGSDGGTDEIYFKKTPVRYIKLSLKERATTWGYSIFEVLIKGSEEGPVLTASSSKPGFEPANAMDGDKTSGWASDSAGEQWLMIDLRKDKELGGLQIIWGPDYAKSYDVLVSPDGNLWTKAYSTYKGNGKRDLMYFNVTRGEYVKILCKEGAAGARYSIEEITVKGPDESITPKRHYELLNEEAPKGYYPKWIGKQQGYWTVVGIDGDSKESLVCEDGSIEPFFGSFSLMPYLYLNGRLVTSEDSKVTQSLEKGYIPIPAVRWDYNGIILDQKVFAFGERGKSATYVWYTLCNTTKDKVAGKLYLTIRPFQVNPPWQYGGLSEIKRLSYDAAQIPFVEVNGKVAFYSLIKPDNFGAVASREDDIVNVIEKGTVPESKFVDDDNYISGALEYNFNLASGKKADFFWVVPLYDEISYPPKKGENPGKYFSKLLKEAEEYWKAKLDTVTIDIPDKEIIDAMKSNLAYILINKDSLMLQPGSRNYKRAWMRDGAIISAALLRMGYKEDVREFIDWITVRQQPDGMIPFILEEKGTPDWCKDWKEYDSQGEYIFAVMEYYSFTKDRKFLEEKLPAIEKDLKFLVKLREQRVTDEFKNGPVEKRVFYGILPESNSHEGYFPAVHSYWDDFWAIKGWKDAKTIALILGKEDLAKWIDTEGTDFRKSVYDSINLVMKSKNIDFVPGCAEKGDFDATSTAIAVFPCDEYENMPQPQTDNTFNKYYKDTLTPRFKEDWRGGFTPYEIRTISSLILMGKKEMALNMLKYFQTVKRPREWNHWGEVVFGAYRHPQYIGDMPHTWIGAEYINAVRNLFVYEKEDKLILGAGIPAEWALSDKGVTVKDLPTYYGNINYTLRSGKEGLKLKVWGDAKPANGFVFKSPLSNKEFTFSELPANIVIPE